VKIWLKIAINAVRLLKFEPVNRKIVVAEKDGGKTFTATFRAGVILPMRRELHGLTQNHTLFWWITPFVLIIAP